MTRRCFAVFYAAVLAACVCFTAGAQDAPFIGVVTSNTLEVRSGAGRAYYIVGELKKGDMVRVEKVLFNQTWYQIRVPKTVTSYVSKAFVDAQGDGETGTINADKTEFKAASLRGPGESYKGQGTLSKGDKVTILGEEGNFYKIVTPADAFVFIPADNTVRKATADDLQAAGVDDGGAEKPDPVTPDPVTPVDPVTPDPVTPDPTTPDPVTPDPVTPVTPDPVTPVDPVTPDPVTPVDPVTPPLPTTDGWPTPPNVKVQTPARSDELKALEMKVLPYFSLPVTEQPLDQIAKAYQDLLAADSLPSVDKQIVAVRLRTIERRQQILDTLERAKEVEKTDHARTPVPKPTGSDLPPRYTAVGLLQPSTVYDGQSLPLLYRVVDAAPSGRTIAYVEPSDEINVAGMLNQLVGIVGETKYDRALKLKVITITRADVLEPETDKPEEEQE